MEEATKLKKLEDVVKRLDDIAAKAKVEQDSVLADTAKMGAWDIPAGEALVNKGFTEKFASDLIDGFLARQQHLKPSAPSLKPISTTEVVDVYLTNTADGGAAEGYLKVQRRKLQHFARPHPQLPSSPDVIREYLRQFKTGDVPTRQDKWMALSMLYKFAVQTYGIENPMLKVDKPRFKRRPGQRLSREQARTFISTVSSDLEWALVTCFFGLRFRRVEAERLYFSDIKDDYLIIHGKERIEELPLMPIFREMLMKLWHKHGHRHGADGAVFGQQADTLAYHIRRIFERAAIEGVRGSPHTLRNTAGALWSTYGGDWTSNRQLLRHSAKMMTDHYAALTIDELRDKDERYNPMLNLMRELGLAPAINYQNTSNAQQS